MKIVFLDIDGVLNSERTWYAHNRRPDTINDDWFDDTAIAMIRSLCRKTDSSIVLSSSWRMHHDFRDIAAKFNLPIIDTTPLGGWNRGLEILEWITTFKPEMYCVIDDVDDGISEYHSNLVLVNPYNGLSYNDVITAENFLKS